MEETERPLHTGRWQFPKAKKLTYKACLGQQQGKRSHSHPPSLGSVCRGLVGSVTPTMQAFSTPHRCVSLEQPLGVGKRSRERFPRAADGARGPGPSSLVSRPSFHLGDLPRRLINLFLLLAFLLKVLSTFQSLGLETFILYIFTRCVPFSPVLVRKCLLFITSFPSAAVQVQQACWKVSEAFVILLFLFRLLACHYYISSLPKTLFRPVFFCSTFSVTLRLLAVFPLDEKSSKGLPMLT